MVKFLDASDIVESFEEMNFQWLNFNTPSHSYPLFFSLRSLHSLLFQFLPSILYLLPSTLFPPHNVICKLKPVKNRTQPVFGKGDDR